MIATHGDDPLSVPALDEDRLAGCTARNAVGPHASASRTAGSKALGGVSWNGEQGGKWKSTPSHLGRRTRTQVGLQMQPWVPEVRLGDGHGVVRVATVRIGMTRDSVATPALREQAAQMVAPGGRPLNV